MNQSTAPAFPVQVNMTRDERRALRHLAIDRDTSVSAIVRKAIADHIPELRRHVAKANVVELGK